MVVPLPEPTARARWAPASTMGLPFASEKSRAFSSWKLGFTSRLPLNTDGLLDCHCASVFGAGLVVDVRLPYVIARDWPAAVPRTLFFSKTKPSRRPVKNWTYWFARSCVKKVQRVSFAWNWLL